MLDLLYDEANLLEILKSFHVLTGLRIGIFDVNFCERVAYPSYCAEYCMLIRQTEQGLLRCNISDRQALERVRNDNTFGIYECHAGLCEGIKPINHNGECIGYMMIGQALRTTHLAQMKEICKSKSEELGLDEDELYMRLKKSPMVNEQALLAMTQLVDMCISYIILKNLIYRQHDRLIQQFTDFVDANLAGELSIAELTKELRIGKTALSKHVKQNTGKTINEFVTFRRMDMAKHLLTNSDDPVSKVSRDVGIADYNYFTKLFKNATGVTPLNYRRQGKRKQMLDFERHSNN